MGALPIGSVPQVRPKPLGMGGMVLPVGGTCQEFSVNFASSDGKKALRPGSRHPELDEAVGR